MSGIQNIADCMKAGITGNAQKDDISKFLAACVAAASELDVDYWLDSMSDYQAAMVIRAAVLERIGSIDAMSKVALSRGYLIPDSPFVKIEQINRTRQLFKAVFLEGNVQARMLNDAKDLSQIAVKYEHGQIRFDRSPAGQLSSYEISVDGIAPQSGDPLADILGYQPDGDLIKRKRAIDSLARLDFTKRKPYLLFTLETERGIVVCWSKMRDAAGYRIKRRDVFYSEDLPDFVGMNSDIEEMTKELLRDERVFQALSFYDWTSAQDVCAYLDDSVSHDTLYSYRISGIQKKAPASPFIFDVPTNALLFSPALASAVQESLEAEADAVGRSPATISPYPAIAAAVYGEPAYGWIVAGCNVLSSIRGGSSVDVVRANSYIGSTAEHIFAEARAGRLFVPSDISAVQQAVESAVSSYGVSQTILALLDGTGVTNFVSGKDDPNGIQPTQQSLEGSTSGLARILAAIDPETATLDPKLIVVGGQVKSSWTKTQQVRPTSEGSSELDEIMEGGPIDLTTFEGIARFMQLIRTIYDFYPGAFV